MLANSSSMSGICSICGSTLMYERTQLRQDDEPATLVVGCPIQLAIRFRSIDSHNEYHRQSSIRKSWVPIEDRPILSETNLVTPLDEVYAMRVMITSDFDVQERYYRVGNTQCLLNGQIIHAQFHSFNPLWCNNKDHHMHNANHKELFRSTCHILIIRCLDTAATMCMAELMESLMWGPIQWDWICPLKSL
jgi:hypothetical protein